ncbi:MAG: nucleotidyltransferase domain-containing protein [Desulfococcaceae bacterium]|jgi:predicted nucleotidyltransferase|nr:nucleotidyltransferase domain-containing protein [Desulfococcaceae bacterium]
MNPVEENIKHFADKLAALFDPERIILFGSHASGNPGPDSDADLLVIMDFEGRPQQKAYEIRKKISRSFPLDLLVRRPADVATRIDKGDFFLRDIILKGKVLYERSGQRMV